MNEQRRTRTESTRTHNRSLMDSSNTHPQSNRDVTHQAGHQSPAKGQHRDQVSYGKKTKPVSREEEKEDFKTALKSSDRFANGYGDEDQAEEIDDSEKLALSEEDDDDFGVRDFNDDDEDIEEIKKASRH